METLHPTPSVPHDKRPSKPSNRLIKNRAFSRAYRLRSKAHIASLECQYRLLSSELRNLRKMTNLSSSDEIVKEQDVYFQRLREVETGKEDEIVEIMDELSDNLGPEGWVRVEYIRKYFQRTVSVMIPECMLLGLVLNEEKLQEVQSLLQATLPAQTYEVLMRVLRESAAQRTALTEALDGFKHLAADILHQSNFVHTLIRTRFRPMFRPSQVATMALRLRQHFLHLKAEEVLDYGRNCTEVLKDESS